MQHLLHGETILHYVFSSGNKDIIALFLNEIEENNLQYLDLIAKKTNGSYGYTPIDMVLQKSPEHMKALFDGVMQSIKGLSSDTIVSEGDGKNSTSNQTINATTFIKDTKSGAKVKDIKEILGQFLGDRGIDRKIADEIENAQYLNAETKTKFKKAIESISEPGDLNGIVEKISDLGRIIESTGYLKGITKITDYFKNGEKKEIDEVLEKNGLKGNKDFSMTEKGVGTVLSLVVLGIGYKIRQKGKLNSAKKAKNAVIDGLQLENVNEDDRQAVKDKLKEEVGQKNTLQEVNDFAINQEKVEQVNTQLMNNARQVKNDAIDQLQVATLELGNAPRNFALHADLWTLIRNDLKGKVSALQNVEGVNNFNVENVAKEVQVVQTVKEKWQAIEGLQQSKKNLAWNKLKTIATSEELKKFNVYNVDYNEAPEMIKKNQKFQFDEGANVPKRKYSLNGDGEFSIGYKDSDFYDTGKGMAIEDVNRALVELNQKFGNVGTKVIDGKFSNEYETALVIDPLVKGQHSAVYLSIQKSGTDTCAPLSLELIEKIASGFSPYKMFIQKVELPKALHAQVVITGIESPWQKTLIHDYVTGNVSPLNENVAVLGHLKAITDGSNLNANPTLPKSQEGQSAVLAVYGTSGSKAEFTSSTSSNSGVFEWIENKFYSIMQGRLQSIKEEELKSIGQKHGIETEGLKSKDIYKKLAVKTHPDKGGDAEEFKKVSAINEKLNDGVNRADVDQYVGNKMSQVADVAHKASIAIKGAEVGLDVISAGTEYYRGNTDNAIKYSKDAVLDGAQLYGMCKGVGWISTSISVLGVGDKVYQGEYKEAGTLALTTTAYTALPYVLGAVPVVGQAAAVGYTVGMTVYAGYSLYDKVGGYEGIASGVGKAYSSIYSWVHSQDDTLVSYSKPTNEIFGIGGMAMHSNNPLGYDMMYKIELTLGNDIKDCTADICL